MSRRYTLLTRLTPEECERRLIRHLVTWRHLNAWIPGWPSSQYRPIQGRVTSRGFRILKYVRYGNGLQPVVRGYIHPMSDGSRIELTVGMAPETVASALTGAVLAALFLIAWTGQAAVTHAPASQFATGLLGVAGTLLLIAGTWSFGRWLARGEDTFLLEFLRSTLEARDETDHRQ